MDIRATLEQEHNKLSTLKIVNYIGKHKDKFKELTTIFFENDYRLTQRSAWPLAEVAILFPNIIAPYFTKLVKKLTESNHHPAIHRNILRILQEVTIPKKYQSQVLDCCFKFILNPNQPIATIAFAITVATKICKPYPELTTELLLVLQHLKTHAQEPGIKSRIKKALNDLEKN